MSLIIDSATGRRLFRTVAVSALAGVLTLSSAHACYTDCSIAVNFTGVFNDETCTVSINSASSNETVMLPQISAATLQQNGTEAGSVPFDITLKDCPASRTVSVFFNSSGSSAADTATGNLVNASGGLYSRNVQVRLRKEDGAQAIIDNAASGQDYLISATGDPLTHRFSASYYANGSASVTAGSVHAIAGVDLVYK